MEGIVDALIGDRFDPAVLVADFADLGDFPCGVVGDAEAVKVAWAWMLAYDRKLLGMDKLTLLVEIVDLLHGNLVRHTSIWSM